MGDDNSVGSSSKKALLTSNSHFYKFVNYSSFFVESEIYFPSFMW